MPPCQMSYRMEHSFISVTGKGPHVTHNMRLCVRLTHYHLNTAIFSNKSTSSLSMWTPWHSFSRLSLGGQGTVTIGAVTSLKHRSRRRAHISHRYKIRLVHCHSGGKGWNRNFTLLGRRSAGKQNKRSQVMLPTHFESACMAS